MKDNFSAHASNYAKFRPVYPQKLYNYLLSFVKKNHSAWDCGCGNGQVAGILSKHFDKVIATDISAGQIGHAVQRPNIDYRVLPAEKTDIPDSTISLITVAQAIHWFNFEEFYREVLRVATPEAIIAIWCYNLLEVNPEIDTVVRALYGGILGEEYWDPERKYIEEHYLTIPFPFEEIRAPDFQIETTWNLEQLIGYLSSWSAVQHYIRKNEINPVEILRNELTVAWGAQEKYKVIFPIFTRLGKVKP
jgi:SAM-dependent methyltransferase